MSPLLLKLNEEVQWFIIKRHNGSNSYLLKYYINQKLWWKESVSAVYIRRSKAGAESKKETVNIFMQ
jgi:hypothetical protein